MFMRLTSKKKLFFIIPLVVFIVYTFYDFQPSDIPSFKCASDFTDPKEYMKSVNEWVVLYLEKHPRANLEEIIDVRDKLSEKHDCKQPSFVIENN